MTGRAALSRRSFLASLSAAGCSLAAEIGGKGKTFPAAIKRYADGATEFPVTRLTDPAYSTFLPPVYSRAVSRHNFVLCASDMTGRFEAFRIDIKSGQMRQFTEASDLDPFSLTLAADEHGFFYLDGNQLIHSSLPALHTRTVYEIPADFERGRGIGVSEDAQYAALVEKKDAHYRLQLIHLAGNAPAVTIAECDEEIRGPIPRPRRASILYRRGNGVWLGNYDGKQNYRLRLAEGEAGTALWSPDGRDVLYLNYPPDPHKLHDLRAFTPDSNEDHAIADTSQFVAFDSNADASVFVGASGSKASPHVLLLVRTVKRELTLAEHRSSDPSIVRPTFAPNSQRVFFGSDLHGKPAIYGMSVEKFVEETDAGRG
jgi:oligogalacturonide lyase